MADCPAEKKVVCVIFGGISTEHEISQRSADTVIKALDPEKYDVVLVGIKKDGSWWRYRGDVADIFASGWETHDLTPCLASPSPAVHGLVELHDDGTYVTQHVDVWIPCLHGRGGEDGTIQGLLELTGIPYVGCGILSSALCMDKATTFGIVQEYGVKTPRSRTIMGTPDMDEVRAIAEDLGLPLFVKPANGGSSFGVSKVESMDELEQAVRVASELDPKVCFESAIVGLEVGCAVMGHAGGELVAGIPDELRCDTGFVRLHQEKKPGENKENLVISCPPNDVSEEDQQRVREEGMKIYKALGCEGFARVDMFLTPEGDIVFNEVNTFPGMTYYSRFPRMMRAAGIDVPEVMDRLIEMAYERVTR